MRIDKLLLTELRIIQSKMRIDKVTIETADLEPALIDNENLNALGYNLTHEGVVRLAKAYKVNPGMQSLSNRVMELEPEIEVSPMYPNFPIQVLEMSELEFRIHQSVHYLTTYGLEEILDVEINKGWLPETEVIDERIEDKQVANLKTLDFLTREEVDRKIIEDLIGRKERLQPRELELAQAIMLRTNLEIESIPFKENIGLIYGDMLLNGSLKERYTTFSSLSKIAKHPGDILDLVEHMVVANKYKHFKTSVKRGLVELIESFPIEAIEENLASNRWSNRFLGKGGKARNINRNIALIDYLSYNRFSKNENVKALVNELKSGKLFSWNQLLEQAYSEGRYEEVVRLLSQRPGIMFRQVNRLVKLGVDPKVITQHLKTSADKLKTQSIVSALNNYEGDSQVDDVFLKTLVSNLMSKDLGELFNGKKIYIDEGNVDFSRSKLEITDKFAEGGYISNGMAIKIPKDAKFLRFFTYWNDKNRIDIDLHGVSINKSGESSHVGWHASYKDRTLVHSGDITHSDATEYIDLDLEAAKEEGLERVQFNINSYTGTPFSKIDTVFTGLMLLSEKAKPVERDYFGTQESNHVNQAKLYDPKNVIFRHDLEYNAMSIDYGMIDIENMLMYVGGKPSERHNDTNLFELPNLKLTVKTYLGLLIMTQGGDITWDKDEADIVLGLAKSDEDNYVSLIDNNFFMD